MAGKVNNQVTANSVWPKIVEHMVGSIDITIGDEDSPNSNERLITFQCKNLRGENFDGYVQGILSVHSAEWGAFDTDEALDMGGTGPVGTVVNVTDGTSANAFTVAIVNSNSSGKVSVIVNDAGNDTFYVRFAPTNGPAVETDSFTFGSG